MEVTLLGTGCPVPTLERAGTALTVTTGEERFLVDCGPRTVYELIRNGIDIGSISNLLFTHHHIDHNAAFPHFAISSWTAGRESLTVYGPEGTTDLVDALYSVYDEDLAYRKQVGYESAGIEDIEVVTVSDGFQLDRHGLTVDALSVDHSIETYAYRFEGPSGERFVFSGDTAKSADLVEFAADADVLVHDAHMAPVGEPPDEDFVWERYTTPYDEEKYDALSETHCTPQQAGDVAAKANVGTLVLTHFPPYRDSEAIRESAKNTFDGPVIVGEDELTIDVMEHMKMSEQSQTEQEQQL